MGAVRYRLGRYVIDLQQGKVSQNGHSTELNWRAREALRLLLEANGAVVKREEFFQKLWPDVHVDESSLTKCISQLRQTLAGVDPGEEYLETIPRVGYRLLLPAEELVPENNGTPPPAPAIARRPRWGAAFTSLAVVLVLAGTWFAKGWKQNQERLQESRDAYRRAEELIARGDQASAEAAVLQYQKAVAADPSFAGGYASLAWALSRADPVIDGKWSRAPLEAAEKGVAVDANCIACQATLGFFLFYYDRQWKRAEHHLRRALELKPGSSDISTNLAMVLAATGRQQEAMERIDFAIKVKPFEATKHAIRASILYFQKRYPEAVTAAERAISMNRSASSGWDWRGRAQFQMSRGEDAVKSLADGIYPEHSNQILAAYRKKGLEGGLRELIKVSRESKGGQNFRRVVWYTLLGEPEHALDELEKMYELQSVNLTWIGVDPAYDSLRSHPRFQALLSKVGLSAAH